MSELLPWLPKKLKSRIMNLETVDEQAMPDVPGVYIMLSENTEYIYPRGNSRVFYIGKSVNLRQRITEHKKFYLQARDKPRYKYYYPRYEYAAAHGCKICWITCSSAQSAKNLEDNLLITFANYYKAKPVANNQQAWI